MNSRPNPARHNPARRRRLAASAVACGLCLGAVTPYAPAATPSPVAALNGNANIAWETGSAAPRNGLLGQVLDETGGREAIVIVTPGTDDTGLHPRIDGIVGGRAAGYVQYPESFWPVIGGKSDAFLGLPFFAPTYQDSRKVAEDANVDVMRKLAGYDGVVVYTGYSQGAEAVGNAAETAHDSLGGNSLILLISDPRSPWGIKGWAAALPLGNLWLSPVLGAIGIDDNGARNPADTGDVQVISVIVQGDPVADFQWVWYRPVSSLLVDAAGFLTIHSPGDGPYGHLDGTPGENGIVLVTGGPEMLHSTDGKTAYAVYDTYHPLALLMATVYDGLGIEYTRADLEKWDKAAETFYPMTDVKDKTPYGGISIDGGNGGLQATAPTAAAPVTQTASLRSAGAADSEIQAAGDGTDDASSYIGKHRQDRMADRGTPGDHYRGRHRAEPPAAPSPEPQPAPEPQPEPQTPLEVPGGGVPDAAVDAPSTTITSTDTGLSE